MANKKNEPIYTTPAVVREAETACRDNATRLLRNARILFDAPRRSDGLVYVLWSLAVEELGKGELLRRQLNDDTAGITVEIKASWNHKEKFEAGFDGVMGLKTNSKLARVLRVRENSSGSGFPAIDPLRPGVAVEVPAQVTGLFDDGLGSDAAADATVELRFKLLYVDWSDDLKCWTRPGETIKRDGIEARWELDSGDLRSALDLLDKHLNSLAS